MEEITGQYESSEKITLVMDNLNNIEMSTEQDVEAMVAAILDPNDVSGLIDPGLIHTDVLQL